MAYRSFVHLPRTCPHWWMSPQLSPLCHIYRMPWFSSTTDHQPMWNHWLWVCSGHLPSPASQAPREGRTLTSKPRLVTLTIPNVFLCVFHVNSVNEPGTKFSLSVMCDCGWCSHSLSYSFSLTFSLALLLSHSFSLKLIPPCYFTETCQLTRDVKAFTVFV